MESLEFQDVDGTRTFTQQQQHLQDEEPSGTGVEECSYLAQLCSKCLTLFQIILKALRGDTDSKTSKRRKMLISLERSYSRMRIWSDENGVADGGLDAILATSRDLRRDTLRYIMSISQTLTERLINIVDVDLAEAGHECVSVLRSLTAAATEGDNDDSSGSEFSDSSSCSVTGVLKDLIVDTTCLLDLEPLLNSPILPTNPEPTAVLDTSRITWNPHQPYSDKVSVRFPMATDNLVNRLGRANYERYLRCQEQKATNELGDSAPGHTVRGVLDSASSKFHESGIGSSLPTEESTYAETVMSYGPGEGRKVRVPPLPDRAKEGLPFSCVACGKLVKIVTNSSWKQHVYGDLQPWLCLEADCIFTIDTFSTETDWIAHLALHHRMEPEWRMVECPLCRFEIGPGKVSITNHLGDHLEEVSLAALPVDCEPDEEAPGAFIDDSAGDLHSTRELDSTSVGSPATTSDEYKYKTPFGQTRVADQSAPIMSDAFLPSNTNDGNRTPEPDEKPRARRVDHGNYLHSISEGAERPLQAQDGLKMDMMTNFLDERRQHHTANDYVLAHSMGNPGTSQPHKSDLATVMEVGGFLEDPAILLTRPLETIPLFISNDMQFSPYGQPFQSQPFPTSQCGSLTSGSTNETATTKSNSTANQSVSGQRQMMRLNSQSSMNDGLPSPEYGSFIPNGQPLSGPVYQRFQSQTFPTPQYGSLASGRTIESLHSGSLTSGSTIDSLHPGTPSVGYDHEEDKTLSRQAMKSKVSESGEVSETAYNQIAHDNDIGPIALESGAPPQSAAAEAALHRNDHDSRPTSVGPKRLPE